MFYFLKKIPKYLVLTCLFFISHITQAQHGNGEAEVKTLLNNLYSYNKLMFFQCFIPKSGISKEQTTTILKRYVNSDEFEEQRDKILTSTQRDFTYWSAFYGRFFTEDITGKFAKQCDFGFQKKFNNHLGYDDLRFSITDAFDFPDLEFQKLIFRKSKRNKANLVQVVEVKLEKRDAPLIQYTFKLENGHWRIHDIAEVHDDPDRQNKPESSLQDSLRAWKE